MFEEKNNIIEQCFWRGIGLYDYWKKIGDSVLLGLGKVCEGCKGIVKNNLLSVCYNGVGKIKCLC